MDMQFQIKLETEKDVLSFVEQMNHFNFDIDACIDHYIIDAKSILGVLGLGMGKVLKIIAHTEECENLKESLRLYMV